MNSRMTTAGGGLAGAMTYTIVGILLGLLIGWFVTFMFNKKKS